jgi:serine protease AprX
MTRLLSAAAALAAALLTLPAPAAVPPLARLDAALATRAAHPEGRTRVIVSGEQVERLEAAIAAAGGTVRRTLRQGVAAEVADAAIPVLAAHPAVASISVDRAVVGAGAPAAALVGARRIHDRLGLDGSGITVATIDSGIAPNHDDLPAARVRRWVDFVNGQSTPYDDYGHGTHVAGIIAGTGADSGGARRGIAPGSRLVVLKALDGSGSGLTSDVVAALDYAVDHREELGIRVINLSVAAGVYESFFTDPLTRAARRAVDAGIVVVAAAGNYGRTPLGTPQYGGITAPGNAPWVLTVGASAAPGRAGAAGFSSRGPTAIDDGAKPDLVAPGIAVESAADPSSALFASHPGSRLWGTVPTVSQPYLSLTGTSMSAAVVAGTVALMLQAEPALTPNAVKAILEYTAIPTPGEDDWTAGAGTLNAAGAVALARRFADPAADPGVLTRAGAAPQRWSRRVIWGGLAVTGDGLAAGGNAWATSTTWGAARTASGAPVSWGPLCAGAAASCATVRPAAPDHASTEAEGARDTVGALTLAEGQTAR